MEAIEKIEDFIIVNRLKAHTKIPNEKDLCDLWGVSRSTLRQAVDVLVENGVLYRVKDKGVYVAEKLYQRDMAGVVAMVKDLVDQGNKVDKHIISMKEIEASKHIAKKLRVKLGTKVYEIIRCRHVNDVPCSIETTYINAERYPGFIDYYGEETSMDGILQIDVGAPLFYASGVSLSEKGEMVMYYKQLIRSDKFEFVCTVES